ncbi:MAG: UDP-N-acetylglucosamine--N-acetylmuramyl-(pentapeptide) pyrophosphoryl-undecaprenol N-acetylglucosamine transferase [Phycisphaerales bacterium]|jgi:UDP-N-acetylglucosamine--N-acetylmuramyl-(pentapeptide) pyrophosphoryl-undecaprenol N-acetylglucosamine transferase|nr:UDP-N-acetylglucosamine--N-acetylmuramyl-(pentapeptide) pyrophosphoryl-undecaprenol N-acetylglucosamine transferase [Phycisphaerales bacterium]
MPNILIAGGGSGGHVAPAIAVGEALVERDCDVLLAHSTRRIDVELIHETAFEATPLRAMPLSLTPLGFWSFCIGFLRAANKTKRLIQTRDIRCVVATGGFVAAPALWAAHRMQIPTVLLNFDRPAGKANKLASRWADQVLSTVAWEHVNAQLVPPPLRRCTISKDDQRKNRVALGLDPSLMTLIVTGASQGAETLNELVPALATKAPTVFKNWQIFHLSGPNKAVEVRDAYEKSGVKFVVQEFTHEMGAVWGAADFAITRGGANTIAEIAFNAVPSIVLPYPFHTDDHQRTNALPLADLGGVLIETDHTSLHGNIHEGGQRIVALLQNHEQRFKMQQALALEAPINGASVIADAVLSSI